MSTELATIPPMTGPNDRTMSLSATPSECLPAVLEEIQERSRLIRLWIRDQMIPGVHYGVPPGVKQDDRDPSRWTSKPSLYQTGADAVIAAEKVVPEFEADEAAWRMMGGQTGRMVYRCRLRSQLTGVVIGEGIGAARIQDNADDFNLNKGIKMACKRAKVAAVLNAYALSDLFTQDLEDRQVEQPDAPGQATDAAKAKTRSERKADGPRVTAVDLENLYALWQEAFDNEHSTGAFQAFLRWAAPRANLAVSVAHKAPEWDRESLDKCTNELKAAMGEVAE